MRTHGSTAAASPSARAAATLGASGPTAGFADLVPSIASAVTGVAALSLALGIGALQLCLDRGQGEDWFGSVEIQIEAALAQAVAAYGFEERTDDWRTFDIWFDNFWSDWATQSRIAGSLDGVRRLRADLGTMTVRLVELRTMLRAPSASPMSR